MKYIPLKSFGDFKVLDILNISLQGPGQGGVDYEEMRKRMRVFDAVEALDDDEYLQLEDADYVLLMSLVKAYKFGAATPDLYRTIECMDKAKNKLPEDKLATLRLPEREGVGE